MCSPSGARERQSVTVGVPYTYFLTRMAFTVIGSCTAVWLPYAHDLKSCSVCLFETVLSGQDSVNLKTYYPSRVQNTFERPTVAVFLTQITIIINYSLVHLLCAKGCNKSSAYTSFIHHEKVHNVFLLWPYYRSLLKTEA